MGLRSVKRAGAARVALVGADTVDGSRVRGALARSRVSGSRVDLYGTTHGEVVLSEYAGEARLIQEPELYRQVAETARSVAVDTYCVNCVIDLYQGLYAEVVGRVAGDDRMESRAG